jgi:hypothetical protein
MGQGSAPFLRDSAVRLAQHVAGLTAPAAESSSSAGPAPASGLAPQVVEEADAALDFWQRIDSRRAEVPTAADYACASYLRMPARPSRLFALSMTSGNMAAEEIFDFSQEDLVENEHVLLDAISEVYLWSLPSVSQEYQDAGHALATEFIKTSFDGRLQTTPIISIQAGSENFNFCCHFHAWQGEKLSEPVPRTPRVAGGLALPGMGRGLSSSRGGLSLSRGSMQLPPASTLRSGADRAAAPPKTYTLAELTSANRPKGLDEAKLETYLSDAEFQTAFGTTPDAFAKLPVWVRTSQKKKVGLV